MSSLRCRKERGMVGGKDRRVAPQDGRNSRVSPELTVQEATHRLAVPAMGMPKPGIERQVAFIERRSVVLPRCASAYRHIEHREVQEGDTSSMPGGECKGLSRFRFLLLRRSLRFDIISPTFRINAISTRIFC